MALYRYKKADNYYQNKDYIEFGNSHTHPNAWRGIGKSYSLLERITHSSRIANIIIPSFFIVLGVFFIYQYFFPFIQDFFRNRSGQLEQGNTALVADNFINKAEFISSPAGLTAIAEEALDKSGMLDDPVSNSYDGTFYITIPSLGIESLPVKSNVDSINESVYNEVLKTSLAHFKNTGLPISDVANNMVVYGHSAAPTYNPSASDPEVAFSFIPNLKIGDEIYIDMDGERYKYRMFRSKIVDPSDISIITGTSNRKMLTLFTCYPPGNNKSRYVAVARPI